MSRSSNQTWGGVSGHWIDAAKKREIFSIRELARQAQALSGTRYPQPATVSALLKGASKAPSAELVALMARVLDVPPEVVRVWSGVESDFGPWVPPKSSHLLTAEQRKALATLVRSLAAANVKAGEQRGDTPPIGAGVDVGVQQDGANTRYGSDGEPIRGDAQDRSKGSGGRRRPRAVTQRDGEDAT